MLSSVGLGPWALGRGLRVCSATAASRCHSAVVQRENNGRGEFIIALGLINLGIYLGGLPTFGEDVRARKSPRSRFACQSRNVASTGDRICT
jgi:hypothetical protein